VRVFDTVTSRNRARCAFGTTMCSPLAAIPMPGSTWSVSASSVTSSPRTTPADPICPRSASRPPRQFCSTVSAASLSARPVKKLRRRCTVDTLGAMTGSTATSRSPASGSRIGVTIIAARLRAAP
jgi:hypothetical protein